MSIEFIGNEKFRNEIFDYEVEKEFKFNKDTPVVLNFTASWCGPCKAFAPALEETAKENEGKFKVFKIDIDQNQDIPAMFGIRSVPTTVFFTPNGQPTLINGNIGKAGLDKAVNEILGIK